MPTTLPARRAVTAQKPKHPLRDKLLYSTWAMAALTTVALLRTAQVGNDALAKEDIKNAILSAAAEADYAGECDMSSVTNNPLSIETTEFGIKRVQRDVGVVLQYKSLMAEPNTGAFSGIGYQFAVRSDYYSGVTATYVTRNRKCAERFLDKMVVASEPIAAPSPPPIQISPAVPAPN